MTTSVPYGLLTLYCALNFLRVVYFMVDGAVFSTIMDTVHPLRKCSFPRVSL